ncbi:hypothetical protein M1D52_10235 [Olivibacter sp. SA151]|uniref:hypothetical protein n=1 Tax=Olivibacter jilunii TaxID=985016 RepID=UPI003F13CA14
MMNVLSRRSFTKGRFGHICGEEGGGIHALSKHLFAAIGAGSRPYELEKSWNMVIPLKQA